MSLFDITLKKVTPEKGGRLPSDILRKYEKTISGHRTMMSSIMKKMENVYKHISIKQFFNVTRSTIGCSAISKVKSQC